MNDSVAPFQWEFDTSSYSLGWHLFEAIAYNGAGESAYASKTVNFVEVPFPPYYALFLASILVLAIVAVVYKAIVVSPRGRRIGN